MEDLKFLQSLTNRYTNENDRANAPKGEMEKVLLSLKAEMWKEERDLAIILECFRVMRNFVAGIPANQEFVINNLTEDLEFWKVFASFSHQEPSQVCILRVLIQLINNLMVQRNSNQVANFSKIVDCAIHFLLPEKDMKCRNYICMAVHTMNKNNKYLREQIPDFYHRLATLASSLLNYLESTEQNEENEEFIILCAKSLCLDPKILLLMDIEQRTSEFSLQLLKTEKELPSEILGSLVTDFTRD